LSIWGEEESVGKMSFELVRTVDMGDLKETSAIDVG